jgi:precorrin-4 methylase
MTTETPTRFSGQLPNLLASLHLLYVGRLVAGFVAMDQHAQLPDLSRLDQTIETMTDEIRATELLHEAALIVGDTLETV